VVCILNQICVLHQRATNAGVSFVNKDCAYLGINLFLAVECYDEVQTGGGNVC
jgi:hypothetical protein